MAPITQAGFVWRVTWHRAGWNSCANSRIFERRHDAERLLSKLLGDDLDLSPLDRLEVHRRPVGAWRAVEVSDFHDLVPGAELCNGVAQFGGAR